MKQLTALFFLILFINILSVETDNIKSVVSMLEPTVTNKSYLLKCDNLTTENINQKLSDSVIKVIYPDINPIIKNKLSKDVTKYQFISINDFIYKYNKELQKLGQNKLILQNKIDGIKISKVEIYTDKINEINKKCKN